MIKANNPPRIPCFGETFCVPIENCPPGSDVTVDVYENPENLIPPSVVEVNDDHVVMTAPQPGTFRLRIRCCPQ